MMVSGAAFVRETGREGEGGRSEGKRRCTLPQEKQRTGMIMLTVCGKSRVSWRLKDKLRLGESYEREAWRLGGSFAIAPEPLFLTLSTRWLLSLIFISIEETLYTVSGRALESDSPSQILPLPQFPPFLCSPRFLRSHQRCSIFSPSHT